MGPFFYIKIKRLQACNGILFYDFVTLDAAKKKPGGGPGFKHEGGGRRERKLAKTP